MNMQEPPADSYEIRVTAKKWVWSFTYPNGHIDSDLHVPLDRPVRLVMSSDDVIHSLYIPAFRIKQDVVPGRYTTLWFQADEAGEYTLFCAEYCGTQHSRHAGQSRGPRLGRFRAVAGGRREFPQTDDARRRRQTAVSTPWLLPVPFDRWQLKVGPTFKGVFGTQQPLADGSGDHGGRELHPRVDPGAAGESPRGLQAGDADLPGPAEERGDRRDHCLPQDACATGSCEMTRNGAAAAAGHLDLETRWLARPSTTT